MVDMGQTLQMEELNKIRNIQLTRTEFAESLGLKPTSIFVRNMFLMVDKDGNGFVGFEEFLDLFQILSSGMVKKKQFNYVLSFKK
jgi:dual oxidase